MIHVDQALCAGCGSCVDECPHGAITPVNGTPMVNRVLCDGCGSFNEAHGRLCIEICPNSALTWVAEPDLEAASEPYALAVVQPQAEVISIASRDVMPWHRMVLPAVSGALAWVGREVVPRLAVLGLDVLDSALDRRLGRWSKDGQVPSVSTDERRSLGRQRRRRHRRGKSRE